MIKFNELKVGDYVIAENEGDRMVGEVVDLNNNEKQVCIDNGVQSFWFETDQLFPIPLDEEQMIRLKFQIQQMDDGTVKYMKGAFRTLIPADRDFSKMEIWYRDEVRHITHPISVHEFQNHYYDMTKVHLNTAVFE